MAFLFFLVTLAAFYINIQFPAIATNLLLPFLSRMGWNGDGVQILVSCLLLLLLVLAGLSLVKRSLANHTRAVVKHELKQMRKDFTLEVKMEDPTFVALSRLASKFPAGFPDVLDKLHGLMALDPKKLINVLTVLDDQVIDNLRQLDAKLDGVDTVELASKLNALQNLPDMSRSDVDVLITDKEYASLAAAYEFFVDKDIGLLGDQLDKLVKLADLSNTQFGDFDSLQRAFEFLKDKDFRPIVEQLLQLEQLPDFSDTSMLVEIRASEYESLEQVYTFLKGKDFAPAVEQLQHLANMDLSGLENLENVDIDALVKLKGLLSPGGTAA